MTDEVLVDLADGIGTITLNRPGRINALTAGMVARLTEVFEDWAGDDAVREIVLRGAGERGFCAGADVRALRDAVVAGETERMLDFLPLAHALAEADADYLDTQLGPWLTAAKTSETRLVAALAEHRAAHQQWRAAAGRLLAEARHAGDHQAAERVAGIDTRYRRHGAPLPTR